ncbi:MAG: RNA-binding protein S1, partial [Syntrophomonadaceae bacterium]|nr:RNA-binding protein S1 [Syntrophomonadaceae bacterium]
KDFIKEGDPVKVKVLNINGKKIALSIRQAVPPKPAPVRPPVPREPRPLPVKRVDSVTAPATLDDKIARFLKESDERMQPLKNKAEPKKRGRNFS